MPVAAISVETREELITRRSGNRVRKTSERKPDEPIPCSSSLTTQYKYITTKQPRQPQRTRSTKIAHRRRNPTDDVGTSKQVSPRRQREQQTVEIRKKQATTASVPLPASRVEKRGDRRTRSKRTDEPAAARHPHDIRTTVVIASSRRTHIAKRFARRVERRNDEVG